MAFAEANAGHGGSRFAALGDDSNKARGMKEKKSKKEKKAEKKAQKEDGSANEDTKAEKKNAKEECSGRELDEEQRQQRKERRTMDVEAFHTIIVARLSCGYERYTRADCEAAAQWLGLGIDIASFVLEAAGADTSTLKMWRRMLKHMAAAVKDEIVPRQRLVELWDLGPRLADCSEAPDEARRLQTALECRFEIDQAFRKELQAQVARRRELSVHRSPPALLEANLNEQPLALFGRPPALGMGAAPVPETLLFDEGRRAFAFRWPRLLPSEQGREPGRHYFERLRKQAPWCKLLREDGTVKRTTCWYVTRGCTCEYTYGTERVVPATDGDSASFQGLMEELAEYVFKLARPDWPKGNLPNCANLNLYETGLQGVGWHADDESLFCGKEQDCLIVSLSLGAPREFWLATRCEAVEGGVLQPDMNAITWVTLEAGDVLSMEGLCQKHYVHCVPCATDMCGPRINVTWRWIRKHKAKCLLKEA